ncbi:MAG TPA: hypothetical protein VNH64_06895, partial [Parvularculaceae bacterium]|nr:hypothetical protein [Parvularculaceae bacterium]
GRDKPLTSLLIGFAALIVLPITAIIFMLIALGIPFGAFLLSVYVGLLCISMIGAGLAVGHLLLDRSKSNEAKIVFFLLGLALLLLVGAAPVVGPVVGFLAVMLGLGVLIRALWSMIAGRPAAA